VPDTPVSSPAPPDILLAADVLSELGIKGARVFWFERHVGPESETVVIGYVSSAGYPMSAHVGLVDGNPYAIGYESGWPVS